MENLCYMAALVICSKLENQSLFVIKQILNFLQIITIQISSKTKTYQSY